MKYFSDRQRQEWQTGPVQPLLRQIVTAASEYALLRWGWEFLLTDVHRSPQEDARLEGHGVHPAWRAADVRTRDADADAVHDVVDHINGLWVYDLHRPRLVVAYAKPHGTGPHIHFQIHDKTVPTGRGDA